jgi:4,5-DOPA dioxygenase extradiol
MKKMPVLFLSHGAPNAGLEPDDYTAAVAKFGREVARPRAIVVVSAHGLSPGKIVVLGSGARCEVVYDFDGFQRELYEEEYAAPGDPALANEIAAAVSVHGFKPQLDPSSKIDHGVWVPMKIAFPDADIPIVQVSMPFPSTPQDVLKLGEALRHFRDRGVLIVASGGFVHNLREITWHGKHGPAAPWAVEFLEWARERIEAGNVDELIEFGAEAPYSQRAHPTVEHFYPLFVALGARDAGDRMVPVYQGVKYGTLSMETFLFT